MAKYTQKLVNEICRYIEADFYSISEICNMFGISRKTFYLWKDAKPEFNRALETSFRVRDESLLAIARTSLRKKLEGYTITEERSIYIPSPSNPDELVLKSKTVKKKDCPPDTQTLKMVLERLDSKEEKETEEKNSPTVIYVQDEHTAEQLRILCRNNGESGGAKKDFNDVDDFQPIESEDKKQILVKHDKIANMYIVKGENAKFVPPGYSR